MMGFNDNIQGIISMMVGYLNKLQFKEVTTALKLDERERNFPHVIILPKREIIENTIINDGFCNCEFTTDVIIEVRQYKKDAGVGELLKLTGDVVDTLFKMRNNEVHKLFDDLVIDGIQNNFTQGQNFILYSSIITIRFSFMFEFGKNK